MIISGWQSYKVYLKNKEAMRYKIAKPAARRVLKICVYKIYFTTIESFNSLSTKMRPQFSHTITFLRSFISLCFWGGMA